MDKPGGYVTLNQTKLVFLFTFATAVIGIRTNPAAWAWGNQGHGIAAIMGFSAYPPENRHSKQ
ncbi:MAG: hypothetical protein JOZ29_06345 [Deltaproteobacteria bacterium]|nr:hypothetical protein [Deltaproteobacteria bacterium]